MSGVQMRRKRAAREEDQRDEQRAEEPAETEADTLQ